MSTIMVPVIDHGGEPGSAIPDDHVFLLRHMASCGYAPEEYGELMLSINMELHFFKCSSVEEAERASDYFIARGGAV